jgi:hypothetical protein
MNNNLLIQCFRSLPVSTKAEFSLPTVNNKAEDLKYKEIDIKRYDAFVHITLKPNSEKLKDVFTMNVRFCLVCILAWALICML